MVDVKPIKRTQKGSEQKCPDPFFEKIYSIARLNTKSPYGILEKLQKLVITNKYQKRNMKFEK